MPTNGSKASCPLLTWAILAIISASAGSRDVGPRYSLFLRSLIDEDRIRDENYDYKRQKETARKEGGKERQSETVIE